MFACSASNRIEGACLEMSPALGHDFASDLSWSMVVPTDHHGQDLAGLGRGRVRAGPDIAPKEISFNVATGNSEDITRLRNFEVTAVQRLTTSGADSGLIGKRES